MARWSLVGMGVLSVGLIVIGCLPEQERTSYGPPSLLGNYTLPTPVGGTGATAGGDAGPSDPNALCEGKGPINPTGDCTVKWSADIFPQMKAEGPLKCTNNTCHGPGSTTQPLIDDTDPAKAWGQLTKFTNANLANKKYIDPCTKDEQASSMLCNIPAGCGTGMPQAGVGSSAPTEDFKTKLKTWLQCGAPNN